MTTTTLAVLVPLLPFLGAAAGLLLGRSAPGFARPLAVLPTLASLVLAALVAARQGGGRALDAVTELTPTGSVPVELALHIDGFAALVAVLVGTVATCVQIYSTGYLRDDPRYASYAALVSLFTSAMFLVVYSGDLMVLLVGWEVMGICSYFLVGHYWETPEARAASLKAFLVTKLGDVPFLIGLLALVTEAGSFRITKILGAVASGSLDHPTLIALLLLAGVAGKSAQFPLHTWLPDAMAGPTPVSALIHAATMVAAGVYFVARLLPLFEASRAAMVVLAVMAAVTMVGSALAALAQDDIKRVLAYSTIGQLGYMTGALATGDRGAAVFHLLSHGAFKALLFLAAGVIIHAAGTNSLAAMSRMRGLRDRVPDAYWTMTVALLALAAIPPFSGFFSKESVLGAAEHVVTGHTEHAPGAAGWTVLVAGLITALLTAAYAARLWLLAFRGRGAEAPDHGRQPLVMNAVLWVLALPSLALGGLAFRLLPDWFDGQDLTPTLTTSVLGTGVALVGGIVTYAAWRHTTALADRTPLGAVAAHPEGDAGLVEAEAIAAHRAAYGDLASAPDPSDPGRLLLGPVHRHAAAGFHLDAVYATLFLRPVQAGASLVRFLDREVVDTYVRAAGALPRLLGAAVRRAQTGNVQTYVSALLAGTVVLAVAAVLVAAGA
ncbi:MULTISPECIES: NADH-quinone oxidoreductase subunit 5 family protein [Streptomyces]|uniref:NADH dehydrogenase subunit NuoL2 n=1 Tax=Streptomyces coelicolor (strain ATCC BAA-471 / A3(2) / M145) TaxID=100226 RepID=Q9F2V5_STRCO|nr:MULTISPECIES: NADH-quinone oxidoreductase subunit L [Streptomyces]MYU44126.1 NADH-quinone oxidoreductase subunit L [Streptomyces sp. SID7813]MDX2929795.1 NADH-quinone oxidoreductase subunit L [Streptomyces sp. NRRL_B-16638]MDX3370037.1 NADH-quinone oxidoreductase subunit L [Streptomyces sp. ME02-6987-2C]MDX3424144.1 NADH-quinone oxidoreductase subunit L [Streptomyces sp. ME02-6985-2c]NSL81568.1 NADH-quinone oxidoreductase subunit L [Streptomyces coelicolor]